MPILYIRDSNTANVIRIEEQYSSLVWTERFQEYGDFTLEIPINVANFEVYRRGNYVTLDDSDDTMIIETLDIDDTVENPLLKISGRSLSSILERRMNASKVDELFMGVIKYSGSIGSIIEDIVDEELENPVIVEYEWWHWEEDSSSFTGKKAVRGYGDPLNPDLIGQRWKEPVDVRADFRKLGTFSYENNIGYEIGQEEAFEVEKEYNKIMDLYTLIQNLCRKCVCGFRIYLNGAKSFKLSIYNGKDKRPRGHRTDVVIFNPVMDNVTYVNYYEDQTEYDNTVFTYIDGPWSPADINELYPNWIFPGYLYLYRTDDSENLEYGGLGRFEFPLDCRSSVSREDFDPTEWYAKKGGITSNPGGDTSPEQAEIPDIEDENEPTAIMKKLQIEGYNEFETGNHDFIKTSEASIDNLTRYRYGVDYSLGDIVEITNANGVVMTGLVNEVVRSYDPEGIKVTPNIMNMASYDWGTDKGEEDSQ